MYYIDILCGMYVQEVEQSAVYIASSGNPWIFCGALKPGSARQLRRIHWIRDGCCFNIIIIFVSSMGIFVTVVTSIIKNWSQPANMGQVRKQPFEENKFHDISTPSASTKELYGARLTLDSVDSTAVSIFVDELVELTNTVQIQYLQIQPIHLPILRWQYCLRLS